MNVRLSTRSFAAMDERTLFDALMNATSTADLEKAVLAYKRALGGAVSEVPFGRRPNNRGAIALPTPTTLCSS
jgi:hypothetical protein